MTILSYELTDNSIGRLMPVSVKHRGQRRTARGYNLPTIENNGSCMCSEWQIGHLPGLLSFSLFLKTKPHLRHSAGVTTSFLVISCRDFCTYSRWRYTSFSEIATLPEISRAESVIPSSACMISCRTVSCLCWGRTSLLTGLFKWMVGGMAGWRTL